MKNNILILSVLLFFALTRSASAQPPDNWPAGNVSLNGQLIQTVGEDPGHSGDYTYAAVSFYIVAHHDDWQIFMGQQAWYDVRSYNPYISTANGAKVIFIYVSDGSYHSKENPCTPNIVNGETGDFLCNGTPARPPFSYCRVREMGAMSSVHLMATQDGVLGAPTIPYPATLPSAPLLFNGHSIMRNKYKNTVSYFLRLSTYTLSYWFPNDIPCGPDQGQPGYINNGNNGLVMEYTNYWDLVHTIKAIYHYETNLAGDLAPGSTPWINIQDPNPTHNPGDNAEHTAAAIAAYDADMQFSISIGGPPMPVNLWKCYCVSGFPQNLGSPDVQYKSALFSPYVMTLLREKSYHEWDPWIHCMNRSYNRLTTTYLGW